MGRATVHPWMMLLPLFDLGQRLPKSALEHKWLLVTFPWTQTRGTGITWSTPGPSWEGIAEGAEPPLQSLRTNS